MNSFSIFFILIHHYKSLNIELHFDIMGRKDVVSDSEVIACSKESTNKSTPAKMNYIFRFILLKERPLNSIMPFP